MRMAGAGTAARMLGSNSDVEDIAQQVFIRVWKSARRYVPRAKFTTWLYTLAHNRLIDHHRASGRVMLLSATVGAAAEFVNWMARSIDRRAWSSPGARGVRSIDLIDFDFPPWHTAEDTLDKISAESLEIVGRVALYDLLALGLG